MQYKILRKLLHWQQKTNVRSQKYEIYFVKGTLTLAIWNQLIKKLNKHVRNWEIEISVKTGHIQFFLHTSSNINFLNNICEDALFKKSAPDSKELSSIQNIRKAHKHFFKLTTNDTLITLIEKTKHKYNLHIINIFLYPKKILGIRYWRIKAFARKSNDNYIFYDTKLTLFPYFLQTSSGKSSFGYKLSSIPLFLDTHKLIPKLSEDINLAILKVETFPYTTQQLYLKVHTFDYLKHSLIIGQTGMGKSKFIELITTQLYNTSHSNTRLIIVDPHASLSSQFRKYEDISQTTVDFIRNHPPLFPQIYDPKIATELSTMLFKSLLPSDLSHRIDRVLQYALYTLFVTKNMTIQNLKQFLTNIAYRNKITNYNIPDYLKHFFSTDFNELITKYYDSAIVSIINLLEELEFSSISSLSHLNSPDITIENIISNNFLTVFSLDKTKLGLKTLKLISGLIIQYIFLLSQTKILPYKLILIIDELSLIENPTIRTILAESRKYDLSLYLTQQYMSQVSNELVQALLSNIYNYFIFKVYYEDAKTLTHSIAINLPSALTKYNKGNKVSQEELKQSILTNLNPQELVCRLFIDNKFYPAFKAKTLNLK